MKKIKMLVIAVIAMMVPSFLVHADPVECTSDHEAEINGTCYATLVDAVGAVTDTEETTIDVVKDVTLTSAVNIDGSKKIKLNLTNNATISRADYSFYVSGNAEVKITGEGTIANTFGQYQENSTKTITIYLGGSAKLEIGKDVTVTGFDVITFYGSTNATLDLYGTLVSGRDDENKTDGLPTLGSGVSAATGNTYSNINIHDNAVIKGEGVGLFLMTNNTTNVDKATIEGATGIAIKAGNVTLNGATVKGTYEYSDADSWNGGIKTTGAAIQVETNKAYSRNIKIVINDGTYTSEHGYAFQEYAAEDEETTAITSLEITAGTFESNPEEGNDGISVSEQFAEAFKDKSFIEAGTVFTSNGEAAEDVLTYTEDLGISESGVVGKVYKISVEDENGKVTVNGDAAKGEEVTFTVTANDGYELDTLVITDEEGNTIVVKDNKFTMPESNVTITATFKKIVVEEQKPAETEPNPDTYDAGVSYMGLALLSLGTMIVSIKKLRNN